MAAEIETAVTANTAAWWDYYGEHVHDGLMDIPTAMELGGIDWRVGRVPVKYEGEITDYSLVVRKSDRSVLGMVGPKYSIIQNEEGAELLAKVLDESDLAVESALSLRGGKLVVICARTPDHIKIANEDYITYTTWANWHDGSGTAKIYTGLIRPVCANTVQAGIRSAKTMHAFRHVGDPMARIYQAREALELTFDYTREIQKLGEQLAVKTLPEDKFEKMLQSITLTDEEKKANIKDWPVAAIKTQEGIRRVYQDEDNLNNLRGTAWGAFQAVIEYHDHGRKYRSVAKRYEEILTQSEKINTQALNFLVAV